MLGSALTDRINQGLVTDPIDLTALAMVSPLLSRRSLGNLDDQVIAQGTVTDRGIFQIAQESDTAQVIDRVEM